VNITPHFTLEEMTFSQNAARRNIDNTPPLEAFRNLRRLCALLEDVRDVCAAPVSISSGYRCEALNVLVGGQRYSQHLRGCAADFKCAGLSIEETINIIIEADLPYDQLIMEFDSWVHISVPNDMQDKPRKQALIIDHKGARPYVKS